MLNRLSTDEKGNHLSRSIKQCRTKIMLLGLGSVGLYLLDYLISAADSNFEIVVVGRNAAKIEPDVNIVKIAALIRNTCKAKITIEAGIDFNNIDQLADCFHKHDPDFIVNTSRVYTGLKYGSISWNNIRAYGIWAPLAVKYIRNIMEACVQSGCKAIVINTSYSDAVNPWLKSAGKACPDFGSGNVNHLIPRIKLSAAEQKGIKDFWNIDVTYATGHFHDVVISKEGHDEGIPQLLDIRYNDESVGKDHASIFARCSIPMPVDSKRNMMNASSNFEIIFSIINAIKNGTKEKFHSPGAFGELGGYPVIADASTPDVRFYIDETRFSIEEMREKNRLSMALDGIEGIKDGVLFYTDELIEKVESKFHTKLMKRVPFDDIDEAASFLID